jgi:signal peptidase I
MSVKKTIYEEVKAIVAILLCVFVIKVAIVETFFVPSSSMRETLMEGDYIFATKYDYGYSKYSFLFFAPDSFKGRFLSNEPKIGDIVIFKPTNDVIHPRYVKRLIGIPGDKIQMINSVLYINDKPVEKKFVKIIEQNGIKYKQYIETLPNGVAHHTQYVINSIFSSMGDNTDVFRVPEGYYFFMGDNRNNSKDSRFELSYVPFENFIAKAKVIFFSTSEKLWLDEGSFVERIMQFPRWILSIRLDRIKSVYSL